MNPILRNNVIATGSGEPSIVFSHGYGCDLEAWADVAPAFEADFRVIRFDHVGSGQSDLEAYDRSDYSSLDQYATAPAIMGNPERPELGQDLGETFCRMDPEIARAFARLTFLSDVRASVPLLVVPTLILQTQADMIAPVEVGAYLHANLPDSEFVLMEATGHCPHMSAPEETIAVIKRYLGV